MTQSATVERKTKETDIHVKLNLRGSGRSAVDSGIPFLDHMLTLMSVHGFMDLEVSARGDLQIDDHHTVEDLGICLGQAIRRSLGEGKGVRRYGFAAVPMDEAMARVAVDLSNRPFLAYRVDLNRRRAGKFDVSLLEDFFRALVNDARITLHIDLISGEDPHHIAESIFKAFGRALDQAAREEKRLDGASPSTKGIL